MTRSKLALGLLAVVGVFVILAGLMAFSVSLADHATLEQVAAIVEAGFTPPPHKYGAIAAIRDYSQPSWGNSSDAGIYWDPANTSGVASNGNDCIHPVADGGVGQGPCLNYWEFVNRWGGYEPNIQPTGVPTGEFTIHVLSGQTSAQGSVDPVVLRPRTRGFHDGGSGVGQGWGSWVHFVGTPTATSTTNLTAVTAKNRQTNTPFQVTMGSVTQFQLATNTTHPSTSIVLSTTSGSTTMTQPLTFGVGGANGPSITSPTEVDTWSAAAGGDSITLTTLPLVYFTELLPQADIMGTNELTGILVDSIAMSGVSNAPSSQDPGDGWTRIGDNVSLVNGYSQNMILVEGAGRLNGTPNQYGAAVWDFNGSFQGGYRNRETSTSKTGPGFLILGARVEGASGGAEYPGFNGVLLDGDTILPGSSHPIFSGPNSIGTLETTTVAKLFVDWGVLDLQNNAQVSPVTYEIWGNGTLDSARGSVYYQAGADAGALTFAPAFHLAVSSLGVACLVNPAAVTTTQLCNLAAATGANLDTSLGTAVVGCLTVGPSGFCNTPY